MYQSEWLSCRKETRMLTVKNPTAMVVNWRLVGADALSEDLTCHETEGCVQPYATASISMTFQPVRPVMLLKKFVKIEASLISVEYIGIVSK